MHSYVREREREDLWHVVCQLSLGTDDTHTNGGNRTEKIGGNTKRVCVCVVCDCVYGVVTSVSAHPAWDGQPALDWLWTGLAKAEVSGYQHSDSILQI